MKYFIVALWTSLGPKVLSQGYDTPEEAFAAITDLRNNKIKHSDGILAILPLVA